MAKPSTRMMMTLAAMTISPKLLVSDCTTIMAMEKMAWVTPEGRPRRTMLPANCRFGSRWWGFSSNTSRMRSSFHTHSSADTPCAMAVARATPATPMLKPATNQMSSPMFSTVATNRYSRADIESPRPVSYTHLDVYKRQVQMPKCLPQGGGLNQDVENCRDR